jgi:hypothetical protein
MMTTKVDEWILATIQQWTVENIELNSPATTELFEEAEQILNFSFPDDFKQLYSVADGFRENELRDNMISMWPISRILKEYGNGDRSFIGFSDYLFNCWAFGFVKGKEGVYRNVDSQFRICDSFKDCIKLINEDSPLLY